jgi:hypothetical protein
MSDRDDSRAQGYVKDMVRHHLYRPDRHMLITASLVREGWPGTGEQDDRPTGIGGVSVGEFSALALVFGGHNPFVGSTSGERLARALNDNPDGRKYKVVPRLTERAAYQVSRIA